MAFNDNRISGRPTKNRPDVPTAAAIDLTNTNPNNPRWYQDENGQLQVDSQEPTREGQLIAVQNDTGLAIADLYVAVNLDGRLTWRQVNIKGREGFKDKRTGEDWDPLLGLYSTLA